MKPYPSCQVFNHMLWNLWDFLKIHKHWNQPALIQRVGVGILRGWSGADGIRQWSGAGLGVGSLRGYHNVFWKSQRFDRPNIFRFHYPSSIVQTDLIVLQKDVCFNRIYKCFIDFMIFKDLSRFHHRTFLSLLKAFRYVPCFESIVKHNFEILEVWKFSNFRIRNSKKLDARAFPKNVFYILTFTNTTRNRFHIRLTFFGVIWYIKIYK